MDSTLRFYISDFFFLGELTLYLVSHSEQRQKLDNCNKSSRQCITLRNVNIMQTSGRKKAMLHSETTALLDVHSSNYQLDSIKEVVISLLVFSPLQLSGFLWHPKSHMSIKLLLNSCVLLHGSSRCSLLAHMSPKVKR